MTPTEALERPISIEFLYLDLSACGRRRETETALDAALEAVGPALAAVGRAVHLEKVHVRSAAEAEARGFVASPTIRIDGRDIQPEAHQSRCAECGVLCNCDGGVDCREWAWRGARLTAAPTALIVESVLAAAVGARPAAAGSPSDDVRGAGAANIARFFEGAAPRDAASDGDAAGRCCGSACCG